MFAGDWEIKAISKAASTLAAFLILWLFQRWRRRRKERVSLARMRHGKNWPCRKVNEELGVPEASPNKRKVLLPGSRLLPQSPPNRKALQQYGLPILLCTDDLLRLLGVELKSLVALANPSDRICPGKSNYIEWIVPKRDGRRRTISSPKPRLKAVQQVIKREILDAAPLHDAAHGFVRQRNIATNAAPHVGRALVVNLDLRDFFEHVRTPQVYGIFRRLGYGSEVARWLARLCTHRPQIGHPEPIWNRKEFSIYRPFRHAPQGAPTSPRLANLACLQLDRRLGGLARRFGATYTRYADDMTFSGDESFKRGLKRFLALAAKIIHDEGFGLQHRKGRIMRSGHRQRVTGAVVNERVNFARNEFDRLKAIIHNARQTGLAAQNRENRPDFKAYLLGCAAHVAQLNRQRGERLRTAILELA